MKLYGEKYRKRYNQTNYLEYSLCFCNYLQDKMLCNKQCQLIDECDEKIVTLVHEYQEKIYALDPELEEKR